jgi:hypothetical protein
MVLGQTAKWAAVAWKKILVSRNLAKASFRETFRGVLVVLLTLPLPKTSSSP